MQKDLAGNWTGRGGRRSNQALVRFDAVPLDDPLEVNLVPEQLHVDVGLAALHAEAEKGGVGLLQGPHGTRQQFTLLLRNVGPGEVHVSHWLCFVDIWSRMIPTHHQRKKAVSQ